MNPQYEDERNADFMGQSEDNSWESHQRRRREVRAYARNLCSFLGFSLCILFLLIQAVGFLLYFLSGFLAEHAILGMGAQLYRVINSDWFSVAGTGLLGYAVALPVLEAVMSRVPEHKIEPKKMRLRKFIMFFVLAMGSGYIFNVIGTSINFFLSVATKRPDAQMNPVVDLLSGMNWMTAVYISFIAPVIEEYIFRGLILNRLRPLGEAAAIVFSAVMFGLLHGNISQFLYAAALGIIFGYVASKTGTILYSSLLHIMVNSYSTFLVMGVAVNSMSDGLAVIGLLLVSLASICMTVAAIAIGIVKWKKTKLKRGDIPEDIRYGDFSSAMYLNPGVIAFAGICISMIVAYVFFA